MKAIRLDCAKKSSIMRTEIRTTVIVLTTILTLMSCGKEKDNSHVPSGRVAHMTVTQHTPDTAYRLEYTFEWQDTLLECVKCLLPDGRTERMECRYGGTLPAETAVYAADGKMHERWTYHYAGKRLVGQTLTMDCCTAECTFRYEGSRPVGISYRRHAADGREHDYEHRFAWQGGNVAEETLLEDGVPVQRTAFRYGDTPNPLRLPLGMELSTCWSLTHTGVMGDYYHMLPLHFSAGCPVAAVCDEGASYTAEYSCDEDGRPVSGTLRHGDIRTEIAVAYF